MNKKVKNLVKEDENCSSTNPENASGSGNLPDSVSESECVSNQYFATSSNEHLHRDLGAKAEEFIAMFPTQHTELSIALKEMIQLYTQVTYTRGLNVNPHPTDKRLAPMAWKSCSYTIHAIETILRDSNKPLLGNLSSRQRDCLECLVRIMSLLGSTLPKCIPISDHAFRLLSILIDHTSDGPSILNWDSLGFLIPLTFALQSLFSKDELTPVPTGGSLELYTLQLMFVCHIVKILITTNINEYNNDDCVEENCEDILNVLTLIYKTKELINAAAVWNYVKYASIPFLRCCVLFYHYLTDVPAPSALLEVGGDTFDNMVSYLGLPKMPKDLFGSQSVIRLVEKWCQHEEVVSYLLNRGQFVTIKEPRQINHLVDLPNDYSELINTVSSFSCPNSDHEDSRNPTMCLVCGEILCSQSYCCQTELNKVIVGACNYHAHKCGAGIGIFLRVRDCEIMFLASPHRGCFVTPPYLDDYGETDQGLRRGNPLHLCKERYKKLELQWLSHSIHEEIARYIESSNSIVPTQWQHL